MESKGFIVLVVLVAPLLGWLEKYIFSDWEYLTFLGLLVGGDTVLGFYKHYRNHAISSNGWDKIKDKLIVYFSLLILIHILSHFTIDGSDIEALHWTKYAGYSYMIVREAISILENAASISKRLVPTGLLKRLKQYDKEDNSYDEQG